MIKVPLVIFFIFPPEIREKNWKTYHHTIHSKVTPFQKIWDVTQYVVLFCQYMNDEWCFRPWFCTVRLYWVQYNLGKWDEFYYESCPWHRITHSTCWPAVQHTITDYGCPLLLHDVWITLNHIMFLITLLYYSSTIKKIWWDTIDFQTTFDWNILFKTKRIGRGIMPHDPPWSTCKIWIKCPGKILTRIYNKHSLTTQETCTMKNRQLPTLTITTYKLSVATSGISVVWIKRRLVKSVKWKASTGNLTKILLHEELVSYVKIKNNNFLENLKLLVNIGKLMQSLVNTFFHILSKFGVRYLQEITTALLDLMYKLTIHTSLKGFPIYLTQGRPRNCKVTQITKCLSLLFDYISVLLLLFC